MTSPVPDWLQVSQAVGETVAGVGAVVAVIISLLILRRELAARRDEVRDRREAAARLVSLNRDPSARTTVFSPASVVMKTRGEVTLGRGVVIWNRGHDPIRDVHVACHLRFSPTTGTGRGTRSEDEHKNWDVIPGGESRNWEPLWVWEGGDDSEGVEVEGTVAFTDVNGFRWSKGLDGQLAPVT